MSTHNKPSGTTDSTPESDDEQTVQTLQDVQPQFDCEITVIASVRTEKSMRISGDGHISTDETFREPDWLTVEIETYRCTGCFEDYDTEAEAKAHLREKYGLWQNRHTLPGIPGQPTDTPGLKPEFREETEISIGDFSISGRLDSTDCLLLVKDSIDILIETSRREYSIPSKFNFESWDPINGGRLTFPNGNKRISKEQLSRAIKHLSQANGPSYDAEEFTLYDHGDDPFLLVAYGKGIMIAPRITDCPTEE
jgi:hypothetical protein